MTDAERIADLEAQLALARFDREFWKKRCLTMARGRFLAETGDEKNADFRVGVFGGQLVSRLEYEAREAGLLK